MSRTFAYARVSTVEQTPENQIREIEAAGSGIEPHRIVTETVSGSMTIAQREGFSRLLDRMEQGDVLVVTKLDRLGRDTVDVSTTVARLEKMGIRVHCLALGGVDLTSSAGMMTMNVINAVAQFERDLLIERTQTGWLVRRRKANRLGGRRRCQLINSASCARKSGMESRSQPLPASSAPADRPSCASGIRPDPVGLHVPLCRRTHLDKQRPEVRCLG
jgi:putative DNA-invertase from lambdoid prophage Rac